MVCLWLLRKFAAAAGLGQTAGLLQRLPQQKFDLPVRAPQFVVRPPFDGVEEFRIDA